MCLFPSNRALIPSGNGFIFLSEPVILPTLTVYTAARRACSIDLSELLFQLLFEQGNEVPDSDPGYTGENHHLSPREVAKLLPANISVFAANV